MKISHELIILQRQWPLFAVQRVNIMKKKETYRIGIHPEDTRFVLIDERLM